MNTTNELLEFKNQIEEAKTDKATAKGRLQQLMKELKEKHGCATLAAAQKKLKSLDTGIKKMTVELDKGIEQLKENYEWE